MKRLLLLLIIAFTIPSNVYAEQEYSFAEWNSPVPHIADYNIDPNEMVKILQNRIFVVIHKPAPIELWTKATGKVQAYPDARFVTGLALLNASKEKVFETLINFDQMTTFMPQFSKVTTVANRKNNNKEQILVESFQSYNAVLIKLKSYFFYQYDFEKDGSISKLMHEGDVGAGAMRYELFPVGPNQTVLAYTVWLDTDSATSTFGMLIKAVPDFALVTPVGNAILELSQIKEKINGVIKKPSCKLPSKPVMPVFAKGLVPQSTLQKLSDLGTTVFVEDRQWVKTEKGTEEMVFISSMVQLNGPIDQVRPISSDFPRFREYFEHFEKVEINDDNTADWLLKIKLIGSLGLSLNWHIKSGWTDENTVKFGGTHGDVYPIWGVWEWMPLENNNTLLVFSSANKINDNAPWLVRFAQKYVPNFDMTSSLFIGMLTVDKQRPWVDEQLKLSIP